VGPTASLDDIEKCTFLNVLELNSFPSVVRPIASRFSDYVGAVSKIRYMTPNM
jgi:hypothetical protein